MFRAILRLTLAMLFATGASPAAAAELILDIRHGRVTLVATDVSLPRILAEWARVGQIRIVNLEQVTGPRLTIHLERVPESEALTELLRPLPGYVAASRRAGDAGASIYERIVILAASKPPAPATAAAAPYQPPPLSTALSPDAIGRSEETPGFITVGTAPARPLGGAPVPKGSSPQGASMPQQMPPPAAGAQVPPTATRVPGVVVSGADLYPVKPPAPAEDP